MATTSDSVLGLSYMDAADFTLRAGAFGCSAVMANFTSDYITAIMAVASRAVEAHCGRDFTPGDRVEQHVWNYTTRRIKLNAPPVASVSSYKIIVGPGLSANISTSSIYVNNQENYIEVALLALAGTLVSPIATLGLQTPIVEITYKSLQTVPQSVIAATGFTAADIINESASNMSLTPGLKTIKIEGLEVTKDNRRYGVTDWPLPPMARMLLSGVTRLAVG